MPSEDLHAGVDLARSRVELADLVSALVAARGLTDRVRVDVEPATVDTDPRRVSRVVGNLLDNAVTHGRRGVAVTARRITGHDGDRVVVTVSDEGSGIPEEYLPRLFDRFSKPDGARAGAGSGLGLAIAQQNAYLLGGVIDVTSEPGKGTRCEFRFPVTPPLRSGETAAAIQGDREVDRAAQ